MMPTTIAAIRAPPMISMIRTPDARPTIRTPNPATKMPFADLSSPLE
jgi:hypothetical protein